MFRLIRFAVKNLRRNLFRTSMTILGAAIAIVAFIMLRTVLWAWNVGVEYGAQDRIATRHKVSFIMPLPKRYADDIRAVNGVGQSTYANWVGARLANKPDEFFMNIAVDG